MATPKQTVRAVAEALGLPEATVLLHDRHLSAANLRSMAGRGRAAAQTTFEDAANLVIAAAGSRNVKGSVETVFAYAPMVNQSGRALFIQATPDTNEPRGLTFGDGLAALIEASADDDMLRTSPSLSLRNGVPVEITITLQRPVVRARIDLRQGEEMIVSAEYGEGEARAWEVRRRYKAPRRATAVGDLQHIVVFTGRTLKAVGLIVAG